MFELAKGMPANNLLIFHNFITYGGRPVGQFAMPVVHIA
jgi:hypothetical protein